MDEPLKLRVFLCHAREDRPVVYAIYTRLLKENWIDPWLDYESLLPGQNRDLKLDDALKSTHVVLVCLSKKSLDQEGDFQREIRSVIDQAKKNLKVRFLSFPFVWMTVKYRNFCVPYNRPLAKVMIKI